MKNSISVTVLAKLIHVDKSFQEGSKKVNVLKNISFEILPGEMSLLLGPSGSGKSTFLTVLAGLQAPSMGEVHLFGQDIKRFSRSALQQLRARSIGFIFQSFHLIDALTAFENVQLVMRFVHTNRRESKRHINNLFEQLGINYLSGAYPATMSQGEKQRVAIARALANNAQLLIADEPTGSLSSEQGMQVIRLLKEECSKNNRGVIIASHDQRIAGFADKVYELRDGVLCL